MSTPDPPAIVDDFQCENPPRKNDTDSLTASHNKSSHKMFGTLCKMLSEMLILMLDPRAHRPVPIAGNIGCFSLCQRFRKFRSEIKWKGPFRFLPTGIFGITPGGGPLILVGIFRPKFGVPFLTNRFFDNFFQVGGSLRSHTRRGPLAHRSSHVRTTKQTCPCVICSSNSARYCFGIVYHCSAMVEVLCK